MRASRLLNTLLLLQTADGLTARQLAAELEVSERTVFRDVQALSEAGVPIYADRGRHGGIRLVDGYRTRLTGLTREEADAIPFTGAPSIAAELGLGSLAAAARLKVLAALPRELRARASRVAQRFHLDAPGWFRGFDDVPHLGALASAVWEGREVSFEYQRGGETNPRRTQPLGLVLKAGTWYLVGRGAASDALVTYRVSRVAAVDVLAERFEHPPGFDLAAAWRELRDRFEDEFRRIDVELRAAPDQLPEIARVAGPGRVRSVDGGSIHLRFEFADEAVTAAVHLAGIAEVMSPQSLRDDLAAKGRALLATYGGSRSDDSAVTRSSR